ncbi:MAG: hypothetical protein CVU03_06330 [Bacteroidetes bacterium HGW-Bacteroidetes-2]|jgi:hypothetical protein|nr:MAG: hypothetical protein CVU03_06330 [Bacteroidetes bacterium HGW-Bacteroidetes-2]
MKNLLFFFLIIGILASSCSSTKKFVTAKPPKTMDSAELLLDNSFSFIHIPVTIQLKDIETFTNNALQGLVYEDNDLEEDNMKMKVWKESPIQISYENGKIKTVFSLKAQIFYRFGTNKLGFNLFDTREFNLSGIVTMHSDVGLSNWNMHTKTTLQSLIWKEHPTMKLAGQDIRITNLITPAIGLFQKQIATSIDNTIGESLTFKSNVLNALETICTPFQMSETYESWLRIVPMELYTTDAVLNKNEVSFTMGMKCILETIVGAKPKPKFDREKIILKPVATIPNKVTTNIVAISTYEDASRLMTQNFKEEEFGSGNKKVSVKKVEIWLNHKKMVLGLEVVGSVNGTIYLSGYPQYNNITQEVYFDQLEYVLDSKSVLAKTANWLASKTILLQLQESCRYSIKTNIEEGKENINNYLNHYSPLPGVFINGTLKEFEFQNIQLTNTAIVAFIKINGTVGIEVNGLE